MSHVLFTRGLLSVRCLTPLSKSSDTEARQCGDCDILGGVRDPQRRLVCIKYIFLTANRAVVCFGAILAFDFLENEDFSDASNGHKVLKNRMYPLLPYDL